MKYNIHKRKNLIILLVTIVFLFWLFFGLVKFFVIGGNIIKNDADYENGFYSEYYVYLPYGMQESDIKYILVEPNNGGRTSDDHKVHEKDALKLVRYGACHKIAKNLKVPLLVPVFDRPESNWKMYTHALDRDTLMNQEGNLARIDLQLIHMIEDLKEKLKEEGYVAKDKVIMSGFSASGSFVNRFTVLHPEIVKAVATGGINCMPIIPEAEWKGKHLIYPIGIFDIKDISDIEFNEQDYKKVSQYIYMGNLDDNDTLPYDDAFSEEERALILDFLGITMHERWEKSKDIYKQLGIPAKMVMYDGIGHKMNEEIIGDITKFFRENTY